MSLVFPKVVILNFFLSFILTIQFFVILYLVRTLDVSFVYGMDDINFKATKHSDILSNKLTINVMITIISF